MTLPDANRYQNAGAIAVHRLDAWHAPQTSSLLGDLRASLFGVQTSRLHRALVADALSGRIDCRIATISNQVCGTVLAAPRSYWAGALARHPDLALACVGARLMARSARPKGTRGGSTPEAPKNVQLDGGPPPLTWTAPGNAWRIVIVGTAPDARGLGVGAALYRAIMRDRSLVARIAIDNTPSIRLHRSVGWRLYRDGSVVVAVHVKSGDA